MVMGVKPRRTVVYGCGRSFGVCEFRQPSQCCNTIALFLLTNPDLLHVSKHLGEGGFIPSSGGTVVVLNLAFSNRSSTEITWGTCCKQIARLQPQIQCVRPEKWYF